MSTIKGREDRTLVTHPGAQPSHLEPFADKVRAILTALGENPQREGLLKTPERVESSLRWLTQGYRMTVEDAVGEAVFEEHHLLPFFGRAHVAYIPDGKILGLSKVARIVDVFARRLQVQERMTDQIADAVMDVLQPTGVGVVIEAAHFCMMMRGVEKQNSRTVTSALRGIFRDDSKTRVEFLRLAHGGRNSE